MHNLTSSNFTILARVPPVQPHYPVRNTQPVPAFPQTSNDDDRELWAACYPPGSFFVITNQSSFDNLPEYRQWQAHTHQRPVTTGLGSVSDPMQAEKSVNRPGAPPFDVHTVFIPYFEESTTPSPQPTASAIAAAPVAMHSWPQHRASVPSVHTQVSPLTAEFNGLMQLPVVPSQYPVTEHMNDFIQQYHYPPQMPLQHPGLNVTMPQEDALPSGFHQAQSAPVHSAGTQYWQGTSSQRPRLGPRSGSLLEELMGGGQMGRGYWHTKPRDENG